MNTRRFPHIASAIALAAPLVLTSCIVPSPSPGTHASLDAVAAVNSANAWAVGTFTDHNGPHELMEYWNGKSWQVVFLPPPIGTSLTSITAVNAANLWAVSDERTLHFGGRGWYSLPNPAGIVMYKVASAPDGSVYGLGSGSASTGSLLRMTPGGWRAVATVPLTTLTPACKPVHATDVAVLKVNDVWVVGDGDQSGSNLECGFASHWNGTAWQPFPAFADSSLVAVSARTGNDVWVVGSHFLADPQLGITFQGPLTRHWNGTKWVDVLVGGNGYLRDVDAAPDGVWAVGTQTLASGFPTGMMLYKWDGTSMAYQPIERRVALGTGADFSNLVGVSVRGGVVTSVGDYWPRLGVVATLVDRRNAT